MFSHVFLAVTGQELTEYVPEKTAYLSCHFSPYSNGLSNLPDTLPPESLLLLDDSMPPAHHDPQVIREQLEDLICRFSVKAVLLDFQNAPTEESRKMAEFLARALPCPVAITEAYAKALGCPVFLPPPPVNIPLKNYLSPWLKQGIYLEIAPEALQITVTEKGSLYRPVPFVSHLPLRHERLLCHYQVEVFRDKAVFTLCRGKEDLPALVQQAKKMGVTGFVGLYQELKWI